MSYTKYTRVLFGIAILALLLIPLFGCLPVAANDAQSIGGIYVYESDTGGYEKTISEVDKDITFQWTVYNSDATSTFLIKISVEMTETDIWTNSMDESVVILKPSEIYTALLVVENTQALLEAKDSKSDITVTFTIREIDGTNNGTMTRTAMAELDADQPDQSGYLFLGARIKGINVGGVVVDMPEILDMPVIKFFVYLFVYFLAGILFLFILIPVVKKLAAKTKTHIDDIIVEMVRKPIIVALFVNGVVGAISAFDLPAELLSKIDAAYNAFLIILFTWLGIKIYMAVLTYLGEYHAKKNIQLRHILIPMLRKVGSVIIFFFGFAYGLHYLGIDVSVLITGMGVAGLVIAFAAQDTLSNFFAGVFLIIEPKFKVHDQIIFDGEVYEIKQIGMRTTQLYAVFKHQLVIVPNSVLAGAMVINITEPSTEIKVAVPFGIAYGEDTRRAEKLALEIAKAHPNVQKGPDKNPVVRIGELADSSINMTIYLWADHLDNRGLIKSDLLHEIHQKFNKEGIEIPFPQQDVNLRFADGVPTGLNGGGPNIGKGDVEGPGWSAP